MKWFLTACALAASASLSLAASAAPAPVELTIDAAKVKTGGVVADPDHAAGRKCSEFVAPMAKLGPHVASRGLEFNTGTQFPAQYRNQLFIAEHGSWHRTQKSGYRVAPITLVDSKVVSGTVFIDGFIQHGEVIGRPVDIAFLADGSMLVSDDHRGRIYRVSDSAAPGKP